MDIIKKIDTLEDNYIVIGVSAGPDSMALLDMVMKNTNKKIVCAHVNHNVRKESDQEEKYLKNFCRKNNIIFEAMKITSYNQNNFENEARIKRYAFYKEILHKYNSHYLLLAHHGDDLIETIFMKIIRGSNLEGYAGIKEYSHQDGYTIIRPLLKYTKDDLLKYNQNNNIKYFIDSTNSDQTYTRNRYRENILPILKNENKDVHLMFLKYSQTLQEYYNYIEDVTKEKLANIYKNNKININYFKNEHNFMKKNIVFYILSNIYNDKSNIIKDSHINAIIKLANNKKPNISINLPYSFVAKKTYNIISFEKNEEEKKNYKIEFQEKTVIDNLVIKRINETELDDNSICRLNSKDIKLPLYIRNRKNGDYIEVLGLNGKKKVKDIFIEKKIPINKRNCYPLLVDSNDNILWIPNLKKSKYNVKKGEKYDIILTSYREREEQNEEKSW